jgi:HD-like signal output (HDOD) protein
VDLDDLYDRAAQDPALTAKLLHVANSAALGLRHKVTNVGEAISYLGLETTRSLILLAHTFSYCDRSRASGFSIDRLWRHSFTTGVLARRIARQEKGSPEAVDECFLAGLLHDIGELLLAVNLPEEYGAVLAKKRCAEAEETGLPLWQAERDQFGASHAEVGAELMAIWNLPITVVEALALHHKPASLLNSGFSPLVAVHVADALERELVGANDLAEDNEIDLGYLENLGLSRRLEGWREACKHELQIATSARAV